MNAVTLIGAVKLAGSTRLNLSGGLKKFPVEIFDLADTLEILDLSGNQLSSLPDNFPRLHKLRILFCSDNQFTELPAVLGLCPQLSMVGFKANQIRKVPAASLSKSLRWLILTDNQLTELPAEIGQCTQMQKLMLAGNQLDALPEEMTACTRLELLRIAANRFVELPEWLFTLPRLSWLAFAGNPYCERHEAEALALTPIDPIQWHHLDVQHKLGEGASGVIHHAKWQHAPEKKLEVAVKLFKGSMTSDGLPHSEKAACISAGSHTSLIQVHGKITQHPADAKGLVMSLIDPSFRNLAGPPNLDSCTRDIYAADTKFTLDSALRIARDIASAVQQLHSKGIMHGDLYAHNILHNAEGECLLGDFGAASFFPLEDQPRALALQRIEVRAWGCLLEELIERCELTHESQETLKTLNILQANCTQENTAARPLFGEILIILESLQKETEQYKKLYN
jgi:hypothetical protein